MFQGVNLAAAALGLLCLLISVLSIYRPNLIWGDPRQRRLPEDGVQRLYRRQRIGTVVFFVAGAALLIVSTM